MDAKYCGLVDKRNNPLIPQPSLTNLPIMVNTQNRKNWPQYRNDSNLIKT
jgi:hypothetical protein